MKLNPEGVEKAKERMLALIESQPWNGTMLVTAALTAYFDHLKEAGLMREAAGYSYRDEWEVGTARTVKIPSDFLALVLRMEATDEPKP